MIVHLQGRHVRSCEERAQIAGERRGEVGRGEAKVPCREK